MPRRHSHRRCARALNRLGQTTGQFVPVAPLLLEVLQWADLSRAPKPAPGQQPDLLLQVCQGCPALAASSMSRLRSPPAWVLQHCCPAADRQPSMPMLSAPMQPMMHSAVQLKAGKTALRSSQYQEEIINQVLSQYQLITFSFFLAA